MNGSDLIARCLKEEGVTWMACFPANPLIEAAAKVDIRPIVFRQERGGINAADGFSRQTLGKQVGVFAAQDGPGVENSFGGIAQAWGEGYPFCSCHREQAQINTVLRPISLQYVITRR